MAANPARHPRAGSRQRYRDPVYDDQTIDGLMRYFKFETYSELRWFLQTVRK